MFDNSVAAIAAVRGSVVAVLRISPTTIDGQFNLAIVGTAWCAASRGIFVTAYHVLNSSKPRNAADFFYLLRAPDNGHVLQSWQVERFLLEDPDLDLVILEAAPPSGSAIQLSAIPTSFDAPPDGTPVLTYGCPAPSIAGAQLAPNGALIAIQTMLFAHASIGIVAAQYDGNKRGDRMFEFNVAWHHGESGGPIIQLQPQLAAISVMQHYRNIQGPHGVMDGPRRGYSLAAIKTSLIDVGAATI
jgi:hypothetical protein